MGVNIIHNFYNLHCSEMSVEEFCTELVKLNLVDSKKIRNALIIREFDEMLCRNNMKVTDIYKALSTRYDITNYMIQKVVLSRDEYEVL